MNDPGTQTVSAGGDQSGGTGVATSTTILSSGGAQFVGFSGGVGSALDTIISSGGSQLVGLSGGTGFSFSTTIF